MHRRDEHPEMQWLKRLVSPRGTPSEPRGAAAIVGAAHVLVVDSECVDDAADYVRLVARLAALTEGVLAPDEVTCRSSRGARRLTVRQGAHRWSCTLDDSGSIDHEPLLAMLGEALAELGARGRVHAFREPAWGQETGFVYCADEALGRLRDAGLMLEDDPLPEPREAEVLTADRMIHGQLVRAGARVEYWADPPFDEMEIVLGVPQEIAGLALPAKTHVLFREDGQLLACVLPADHETAGRRFVSGTRVPFENGHWQLDLAETGY